MAENVAGLISNEVDVFVVSEDVADRGLTKSDLIDGMTPVTRAGIGRLLGSHDQVWHW